MKLTLLALIAVAAVAQGYVLPQEEVLLVHGSMVDNLIREALEYVRSLLKKNQPYALPDVPEQTIVDTDVNVKIKVSGVKISKADDFVVEHIENNMLNLWAKFELNAPQPHMEGDFTVSGEAFGKQVSGTGSFSADLTNMDQKGFIQMGIRNHGLYISKMTLDYDLKDAKFSIKGLNIQGMTEDQINSFLNKNLLPTLNANKPAVCEKVAAQLIERGNKIMAGKTLKQLIDWLKHVIGH